MIARNIFIVVIGLSLLLVSGREKVWLRPQSIALAAEMALSPGKVFRDRLESGGEGPDMVIVPAGSFEMGDHERRYDIDELPVHNVRIQKPFAIGRYEVTFEEYDQYAKATGRKPPGDVGWGRGRRPVIKITWKEATDYAKWLTEQTGKRLPLA